VDAFSIQSLEAKLVALGALQVVAVRAAVD
jgi:hypothetical protein